MYVAQTSWKVNETYSLYLSVVVLKFQTHGHCRKVYLAQISCQVNESYP